MDAFVVTGANFCLNCSIFDLLADLPDLPDLALMKLLDDFIGDIISEDNSGLNSLNLTFLPVDLFVACRFH